MAELTVLNRQTDKTHGGKRVDRVAGSLFSDYSRGRLQQWIHSGDLTVDGRKVIPRHRLAGGELLRLRVTIEPDEIVCPQNIPLDLLFQDEDIIIVNKPAGLVVHPAAGNRDGTLQNALLYHDSALAGVPRGGIVHRLDKDTTGIMVVARNLRSHHHLVNQLQTRTMKRIYEAVVYGQTEPDRRFSAPIGRHPRDRKKMAVVPSGKRAVSRFRTLEQFSFGLADNCPADLSHIEVSLETGRTHQIRVHMTHLGHPLVGDPDYGRKFNPPRNWPQAVKSGLAGFSRQALHARKLELIHPHSGKNVRFESALSPDMKSLLAVLAKETL
jgi:23S rRNA pseudouridine1911/1915/1917 synthase